MDLESLAFDKTLGNILNRISNYIVKCKLNFLSAHVDLSLFNFIKIYDLFLFEDGVIDAEAILVLTNLCQKPSLKEFIELQCLICFENSGKRKKIGVKIDSGFNFEHKLYLAKAYSLSSRNLNSILLDSRTNNTVSDDISINLASIFADMQEIPS
jgi:hypothetical protein